MTRWPSAWYIVGARRVDAGGPRRLVQRRGRARRHQRLRRASVHDRHRRRADARGHRAVARHRPAAAVERFEALLFPAIDQALGAVVATPATLIAWPSRLALPGRPSWAARRSRRRRCGRDRRVAIAAASSRGAAFEPRPCRRAAGLARGAAQDWQPGTLDACIVAGVESATSRPRRWSGSRRTTSCTARARSTTRGASFPAKRRRGLLLMRESVAVRLRVDAAWRACWAWARRSRPNRIKTETVCIGEGLTAGISRGAGRRCRRREGDRRLLRHERRAVPRRRVRLRRACAPRSTSSRRPTSLRPPIAGATWRRRAVLLHADASVRGMRSKGYANGPLAVRVGQFRRRRARRRRCWPCSAAETGSSDAGHHQGQRHGQLAGAQGQQRHLDRDHSGRVQDAVARRPGADSLSRTSRSRSRSPRARRPSRPTADDDRQSRGRSSRCRTATTPASRAA